MDAKLNENSLYARAGLLAVSAMGAKRIKVGRKFVTVRMADEDPLAWWCLTEAIVAIAEDWRKSGSSPLNS